MNLVQVDIVKRVVFPANPSGFYYWTSVYYVDADEFPSLGRVGRDLAAAERLLITADTAVYGWQIHDPPGRGNIVLQFPYTIPAYGFIPSEGEFSLINVARWHLFSDAGRRTYRLNRTPLRPSDIDGDQLSDSGLYTQLTARNTLLAQGWCRNSYGELLTSGDVVRRLTMWQLRHGSKRRNRNPLL